MKIRVIDYSDYEKWYEEQQREGNGVPITQLTDEQFMKIYNASESSWEFNSLREFENEFNEDGAYAPTPTNHVIRFFPNE